MSDPWLLVVTIGAATTALRGVVPAVLDEHALGLAAAATALLLRAPLLAVIAAAAVTTALARAL